MKKIILYSIILIILCANVLAGYQYLEGYNNILNSAYSGSYSTYRGTNAQSYWEYASNPGTQIEWETQIIPSGYTTGYITYIWSGANGINTGYHKIYHNNDFILTFESGQSWDSTWVSTDYELYFDYKNNLADNAGVYYFTVPANTATPGTKSKITIVADSGGAGLDWVMTNAYIDTISYEQSHGGLDYNHIGQNGSLECGSIPTEGCVVTTDTTFVPGTYNLTDGITIAADDVTLDCSGSTIGGWDVDATKGLIINSRSNVLVRNCTFIVKWGEAIDIQNSNSISVIESDAQVHQQYPLYLFNSTTLLIEQNTFSTDVYHAFGVIYIDGVDDSDISTNYFNSEDGGIEIYNSNNNTFEYNTFISDGYDPLSIANSSDNMFNNLLIQESLVVMSDSDNNIFMDITFDQGQFSCFDIIDSHSNEFEWITGDCGIIFELNDSKYNTIHHNYNDGQIFGSYTLGLYNSEYNTIANNEFNGIHLLNSDFNSIYRNTIIPYEQGLLVEQFSDGNHIFYNNFLASESYGCGIYGNYCDLDNTSNNIFDSTYGEGNYWADYNGTDSDSDSIGDTNLPHLGVDFFPYICENGWVSGCTQTIACGDSLTQDTILTEDLLNCPGHGLVIQYVDNIELDCNGHLIESSPDSTDYGVYVGANSGNTVKNCFFKDFRNGIRAWESSNNLFINNYAINSKRYGIELMENSDNNQVTRNTIINSSYSGIILTSNSNNIIWNNTFTDNNISAFDSTSTNNWNTTIGNYWDDFISNPGYPHFYEIPGPGDGIDWYPNGLTNHAPTITTQPNTTGYYRTTYIYDMNATDLDNDILTYSLITHPPSMTIDSLTGLIQWYIPGKPTAGPKRNTSYGTAQRLIGMSVNVIAEVEDGFGGFDNQSWRIIVPPARPAVSCDASGPC